MPKFQRREFKEFSPEKKEIYYFFLKKQRSLLDSIVLGLSCFSFVALLMAIGCSHFRGPLIFFSIWGFVVAREKYTEKTEVEEKISDLDVRNRFKSEHDFWDFDDPDAPFNQHFDLDDPAAPWNRDHGAT